MKRNKLFLLGLFVVFAAVLSLSLVSSTFAKYTTAGEAADSARVAKWGVTVLANSSEIETLEVGGAAEEQVKLDAEMELLAPGTQLNNLADFAITGTPEVAVNVSYTANLVLTGWEASGYYCPLEITVNETTFKGTTYASAAEFEAAVEAAIAALSAHYLVGQNLADAKAPKISVVWKFEGNDDVKDTVLGDASTAPTLALVITATVTQID